MPIVTVLMPVYNAEKFLEEAIKSVLNQTYNNFEFLIINDGSKDKSEKIIESFKDKRIVYLKNLTNKGLSHTLNRGIKIARGKYIVRMDADDISHKNRLEELVKFLEKFPEIDVCGSNVIQLKDSLETIVCYPQTHEALKARLLFRTCFVHPSVIFKREKFIKLGLFYNSHFKYSEDYEFWTRAILKTRFGMVNLPLLIYRVHDTQRSNNTLQQKYTNRVRSEFLKRLNIKFSSKQLAIHNLIGSNKFVTSRDFVNNTKQWLIELLKQNNKNKIFNKTDLAKVLEDQWFNVCARSTILGLWVMQKYFHFCLVNGIIYPKHICIILIKSVFYDK